MDKQPFIRFVIPQNQRTVRDLMKMGNWNPVFDLGDATGDAPQDRELYTGRVLGPVVAEITQLRSEDLVKRVAAGRFDVGIVGSIDVEEFFNERFIELARFQLGRKWNAPQSRLDLAALASSTIKSEKDLPKGILIYAERQKIVQSYIEGLGHNVIIMGRHEDPLLFQENIIRKGAIGISDIQGGGPAQLDPLNPDAAIVAMVNEEGSTARDYGLKVISTIRPIDTIIITTERALTNNIERGLVMQFAIDMKEAFRRAKEFEYHIGAERI